MDAASPPPPPKILVYDGDCSLCIGVSKRLLRWTRRGEETRRAAQEFEGEDAERIAASEAHNELAVMDPATKEIRGGVDGLLWWLEGSRLSRLARGLSWGPLRWAAGVVYPVIAYNRRILAPPKPRAIACACDPDPRPGATIALGAFALAVVVGMLIGTGWILAARGSSVDGALPTGPNLLPVLRPWLGIAGALVLPTFLGVCLFRPVGARLLHAASFAWSLALGSPFLLLWAFALAGGHGWMRWVFLSLGAAPGIVSYLVYRRRLRMLRLTEWWQALVALPGILAAVVPGFAELILGLRA